MNDSAANGGPQLAATPPADLAISREHKSRDPAKEASLHRPLGLDQRVQLSPMAAEEYDGNGSNKTDGQGAAAKSSGPWGLPVTVRQLRGKTDEHNAVLTLTAAFLDDPVANWITRDDQFRASASAQHFAYFLHSVYGSSGHCYIACDGLVAAFWLPPGKGMGGFLDHAVSMPLVSVTGWSRLWRVFDIFRGVSACHPTDRPHYYLGQSDSGIILQ